jgi:hypothetical protein
MRKRKQKRRRRPKAVKFSLSTPRRHTGGEKYSSSPL